MESYAEMIARLAGIKKEEADKLEKIGTADVFNAGSVPEMKKVLDRYKAASGDHSPSHVFELGGELWVATKVVKD
jgi:hypothetical protein